MKFAGKVYSRDIFCGDVCANDLPTLKRKASRMCNGYFSAYDTMVLHRINGEENGTVTFARINKLSPNNTVVRGQWR